MKHLYIKNCKILRKETEENTRNGKITYVLRLEELILLKYPYYLK